MATRISSIPDDREWKQAYLAAILETNRSHVSGLIHDARVKLSIRLRELTTSQMPCEEVKAIHDAYYLLQALQSSLSYCDDLRN